jgi:hypothetical protein
MHRVESRARRLKVKVSSGWRGEAIRRGANSGKNLRASAIWSDYEEAFWQSRGKWICQAPNLSMWRANKAVVIGDARGVMQVRTNGSTQLNGMVDCREKDTVHTLYQCFDCPH